MKSAACCAWLAAVKIARLSALSTSSNQEQIINVKEHPVPVATQQWADGLLHIISLTAKVHRATQEHSCRASTREVCSVLMCFRGVRALSAWSPDWPGHSGWWCPG